MMALVRSMRQSILDGRFAEFATSFAKDQYRGEDIPKWVIDALGATGIGIKCQTTPPRG